MTAELRSQFEARLRALHARMRTLDDERLALLSKATRLRSASTDVETELEKTVARRQEIDRVLAECRTEVRELEAALRDQ